MDAEMAAFEGDMGGFDESPAMLDAGREPSAELQPAPDPESEPEPETIHEWLDAVVPGYGDLYADIFEAVDMEDPADMNNADLIDDDFFIDLEQEGVDEKAIANIKLAVGFEGDDFDLDV